MLIVILLLIAALVLVSLFARERIIFYRRLLLTYTTLHSSSPFAASLWRYYRSHFELMGYNAAARDLYNGWLRTTLGKPLKEVLEDYPELLQAFRDCLQEGVTVTRTLRIDSSSSIIRQLKVTVMPVSADCVVMYLADASVSYEQPEDILMERDFLHQMMNALGQGLCITDQLHTISYVNPTFARMLGYEPEGLIGLTVESLTHRDDVPNLLSARQKREQGKTTSSELRFAHKEGHYVPCLVTGTPRMQNGGILGAFVVITDLTELTLVHEALYDSELRNQALLGAIPDMMFLQDRDGVFLDYHVTDEAIIQDLPKPFLRRSMQDVLPAPLLAHIAPAFEEAIKQNCMMQVEYVYQPTSGDEHYFESRISPYGANRILTITRDITDRKRAEEAMRQSEERYRSLVENLPDIIYVHVNQKIVYINPAGVMAFGANNPDEIVGRDIWDSIAPQFHQVVKNRIAEIQNTGRHSPMLEEQFVRIDGRPFDVEVMGASFTYEGKPSVLVIARDIEERKRAQDALTQSEERFRSIFEGANVGIAVIDEQGFPISLNPALTQLFGYSSDELMARPLRDLSHPEDLSKDSALFYSLIEGNHDTYQFEKRYLHKSGRIIWASLNVSRFPGMTNESSMQVIAFFEDITGRKNAMNAVQELNRQLESRVAQRTADLTRANERLQELDRLKTKFISDISHELRTPISVLNTRIYLMERGGVEKFSQYLPGLKEHTNRLIEFLESIMLVARSEMYEAPPRFQIVDLSRIIAEAASALSPGAELSGVSLIYENGQGELPISAEYNQMSQVVTNLINNALKYTEKGEIRISTFRDNEAQIAGFTIVDTGIGIREEDIPHLFQRFYRGKNAAQSTIPGTGLGLSIVKDILTLHKGTIEVSSELNAGTTFVVKLPLAQGKIINP